MCKVHILNVNVAFCPGESFFSKSQTFFCHIRCYIGVFNLQTYMQVFGLGFATGKLSHYFTKPDIQHLGLKMDITKYL